MGGGEKSLTLEKKKEKKSMFKKFSLPKFPNPFSWIHKKSVDLANKEGVESIPTHTSGSNVRLCAYRSLEERPCHSETPKTVAQLKKRNLTIIGDIEHLAKSDANDSRAITEQPRSKNAVTKQPHSTDLRNSKKWILSENATQNDIPTETPLYKKIRRDRYQDLLQFWKNKNELTDDEMAEPVMQHEIQLLQEKNQKVDELTEALSLCQESVKESERKIEELSKNMKENRNVAPPAQGPNKHEVTAPPRDYVHKAEVDSELMPSRFYDASIASSQESLEVQAEIEDLCSDMEAMEIDMPAQSQASDDAETGETADLRSGAETMKRDVAPPPRSCDDFTYMAMDELNYQLTNVDGADNKSKIVKYDSGNQEIKSETRSCLSADHTKNDDSEVTFEDVDQIDETGADLPSYEEVVVEEERVGETTTKETHEAAEATTPKAISQEQSKVANFTLNLCELSGDESGYAVDENDMDFRRPRKRHRSRSQRQVQRNSGEKCPKTERPPVLSEQFGCDSGYFPDDSDLSDESDLQSESGRSQDEGSQDDDTSGISSGQEESYSSTETDIPPARPRKSQVSRRSKTQRWKRRRQRRERSVIREKKHSKKVEGTRRRDPTVPREEKNVSRKAKNPRMKWQNDRRTPSYQKDRRFRELERVHQRIDALMTWITTFVVAIKKNDDDSENLRHAATFANCTFNGNVNMDGSQNDIFAHNVAANMKLWNEHCRTGMTHND